ncbi:MAG: malate synthase A [Thaumarchaeota archaeon]|nr:malate synthase A [Nitrososphaerota archaeon]
MNSVATLEHVEISAPVAGEFAPILTPEALSFAGALHREFSETRKKILKAREGNQILIDAGSLPNFLQDTKGIRDTEWKVGEIPADLRDRRVEITGPAGDRKMVINALNSGASTYMADFEDSQSPTWEQTIQGQVNLRDALDRSIRFVSPEGKVYSLNERVATLIVRPRGWHLLEKHVFVDGEPISASLFDFGLFAFHNADKLGTIGTALYFYLPKLESYLEARLWEQVFVRTEERLGLSNGCIKATVLIETLPAAFEMEEILYELRGHIVGLNCGRWDYIFSYIKKLRNHPQFVLPDRAQITMGKAFLASYVNLLIKTCHKRGAYAIGGMSAYIPVRGDEEANSLALLKVRADKEREVMLGHDGTWVAHPGLVQLAKEVFDSWLFGPNQLRVLRDDVNVTRDDLLRVPAGVVTEDGIRTNISVGLCYLESWLAGKGCVPINNLMEDAATAEISRAQLWQWVHHGASLKDGRKVTSDMVGQMIFAEVSSLSQKTKDPRGRARVSLAGEIFERITRESEFPEFLTLAAYDELLALEKASP